MVLHKRNPTAVIAGLTTARGVHPLGYGSVLNNPTFRAIVIGAGPAPVAAAMPKPATPAASPTQSAAPSTVTPNPVPPPSAPGA